MHKHLWEIDHPYYGSDTNNNPCESFAELRKEVDQLSDRMNHVYRFDWHDWSQPMHDDLRTPGEDPGPQQFVVFLVLSRHGMMINFTCPISHDQEAEVLAWLRGPRILGALRMLWEPILDQDGHAYLGEPASGS